MVGINASKATNKRTLICKQCLNRQFEQALEMQSPWNRFCCCIFKFFRLWFAIQLLLPICSTQVGNVTILSLSRSSGLFLSVLVKSLYY